MAIWAHIRFWSWYYHQNQISGHLTSITSQDGWRIALEHIPHSTNEESRGVILCCPGLACNARIFHLNEDLSFVHPLSERGFEVWILHPRGMGESQHPVNKSEWDYGYSDYVDDALSALKYVYAKTETPVIWVGHSMGGLIGYELAAKNSDLLKGLITLGTPTYLGAHPIRRVYYWMFKWFCKGLTIAYLGKLSTLVAPWAGRIPALHPKPLYVNLEYLAPPDLRVALAQMLEDIPRKILDEFGDAIDNQGPLSKSGWRDYRLMLQSITIPILAIAGDRDGLAPHEVTSLITEWGPDGLVEFKEFQGYGHCEIVLSQQAQHEVIPYLISWLEHINTGGLRGQV